MPAPRLAAAAFRAGAAAVAFLTRAPVGERIELRADDIGRGSALFPLVGAGVGALVGLLALGLNEIVPSLVAAALALAFEALLTGAIHLDALADAADGLGARSRAQALAIMREPAVGAFGATALVLDLVVKTAALAALVEGGDLVLFATAAWAAGRASPLVLAAALPYARPGEGSGRTLTDGPGPWPVAVGLSLAAAIAAAATGLEAAAVLGAALGAAAAVGLVARARFGGVTGDVFGASVEVATTLGLVASAAAR